MTPLQHQVRAGSGSGRMMRVLGHHTTWRCASPCRRHGIASSHGWIWHRLASATSWTFKAWLRSISKHRGAAASRDAQTWPIRLSLDHCQKPPKVGALGLEGLLLVEALQVEVQLEHFWELEFLDLAQVEMVVHSTLVEHFQYHLFPLLDSRVPANNVCLSWAWKQMPWHHKH